MRAIISVYECVFADAVVRERDIARDTPEAGLKPCFSIKLINLSSSEYFFVQSHTGTLWDHVKLMQWPSQQRILLITTVNWLFTHESCWVIWRVPRVRQTPAAYSLCVPRAAPLGLNAAGEVWDPGEVLLPPLIYWNHLTPNQLRDTHTHTSLTADILTYTFISGRSTSLHHWTQSVNCFSNIKHCVFKCCSSVEKAVRKLKDYIKILLLILFMTHWTNAWHKQNISCTKLKSV